jgi:hypothetical protein
LAFAGLPGWSRLAAVKCEIFAIETAFLSTTFCFPFATAAQNPPRVSVFPVS